MVSSWHTHYLWHSSHSSPSCCGLESSVICRWISAPLWLTGAACITTGCQVISAPVSGTYIAPSPLLTPWFHRFALLSLAAIVCATGFFSPHLKYIGPKVLLLSPMDSTLPSGRPTLELAAISSAGHGESFLRPLSRPYLWVVRFWSPLSTKSLPLKTGTCLQFLAFYGSSVLVWVTLSAAVPSGCPCSGMGHPWLQLSQKNLSSWHGTPSKTVHPAVNPAVSFPLCFFASSLIFSKTPPLHSSPLLFSASAHVPSHSFPCCVSSLLSACFSFHMFPHMSLHESSYLLTSPHICSHESRSPTAHSFHPVLFISEVFPSPAAAVGHSRFSTIAEQRAHVLLLQRC